jgi:hypothetical protein
MCAWTAGTAAVLALARWIEPAQSDTSYIILVDPLEYLIFGGLVLGGTVSGLPLMVSCVGLVLAEHGRRRFALWVLAMAPLVSGLLFASFFLVDCCQTSWHSVLVWARLAAVEAPTFEVGLLGVALGGLAVLRSCGYRLIRLKNRVGEGSIVPEGPLPPDALCAESMRRRWWQSRFVHVVVAMAGVAGVLCWPAWRFDAAKRKDAFERRVAQEWEDVGAEASLSPEGDLEVVFWSGYPLSEAALAKLTEPTAAKSLVSLKLFYRALTDDQMQCLSGLRSLKRLSPANTETSDAGLEHLRGLTGLESLSLRSTHVTDKGMEVIAELKGLRELALEWIEITDAGLARLHGLKGLRILGLEGSTVTAQGIAKLREALPECEVFYETPRPP